MIPLPQKRKAVITYKEWVTKKVLKVEFKNTEPSEMQFIPGQFVSIKVSDVAYRAYSSCSDANDKFGFTIVADAAHEGLGANFFRSSGVGNSFDFIGPSGRFFLKNPEPNLVFVATGTGIAPFISMFKSLKDRSKIKLYFGVRTEGDMFFKKELDEMKIYYMMCYSQVNGRVTEHVKVPHPTKTHVYLCGNPNMVDDMKVILEGKGVPKENVIFEKYTHAA